MLNLFAVSQGGNQTMKKTFTALAASILLAGMGAGKASATSYEVKKGDSLWKIAKQYNTTVYDLKKRNNLTSNIIFPKQYINIDEVYIVKPGDTLSEIAKKYGVTVKELKGWNKLSSDLIIIGQKLMIKVGDSQTGASKISTKAPKAEKAVEKAEEPAPKAEKNVEKQAPVNENKTSNNNQSVKAETNKQETKADSKEMTMKATAYTAQCNGCSGITATGINLKQDRNAKVVAVDPNVIPLGSKVHVEGYGTAVAGDIGSAIKGNRIDVHVPTKKEASNWGIKEVKVKVLN